MEELASKKKPKLKKSFVISLGGVISSLCLLLMFFTAVFPALSLTLPLFAGLLIMVMSIETNPTWGFITFSCVSILSFFTTPDKQSALFFALFFGYYPILKYVFEKLSAKILTILLKLIVFNLAMAVFFYLINEIFFAVDLRTEFSFLGDYLIIWLLAIMNIVFYLYDRLLDIMRTYYVKYFKPIFLPNYK